MRMSCGTCGQALPRPAFKQGDIVEVTDYIHTEWVGLCIVIATTTNNLDEIAVVMLTGKKKGQSRVFSIFAGLAVVHGYIHINRDELLRADARYRVGRSFEAIPVRSASDDATYHY